MIKHLLFILTCYFIVSPEKSFTQNQIEIAIQKLETAPSLSGSLIGFCAIDAQSGKIIAESSSQNNLAPASVLKLVTTSAALDILGPEYQFITTFSLNKKIENENTLSDIIVSAGGDPTIASKYFFTPENSNKLFNNWANSIAQKTNLKSINQLIIDLSAYDTQYIPNTWIWEDMGNYYGAGVYALSVYDNMCTLFFNSPSEAGKQTKITKTIPEVSNTEFNNQVLSSEINRDKAYVFGSPIDNQRVIRGTIPMNRTAFEVKAALPSPPLVFAQELKKHLSKIGITVGEIKLCYSPIKTQNILFQHHSPTLQQIVNVTNHESVNLFAEHLVKQLAYEKYGAGNFSQGIEIIKDYWAKQNINLPFLEDGSGLSRFNAITAKQLTQILYLSYRNPKISHSFFNSIPCAPNGTLWYFNARNFPNNCLRAKSGSMTRIRSFAGELKTDSGKIILFSIITNNFSLTQTDIIKEIQTLLLDIKRNYRTE